jgi:cellulose synthase/poly-beta-1,6-N-acetylglucosamine synthase-like glycosyltransferase
MSGESSNTQPSCTVVVCTRDRPEKVDQCLAMLRRLTSARFEVLVVDNAPADDRTRRVASRWNVQYLLSPLPGLSRARNDGARSCDSECVAYLDDDSMPEPNWLSTLLQEFRSPGVMAVCGAVLPTSIETESEKIWAAQLKWQTERRHGILGKDTPDWFVVANFGGIGDGGNMAFRREAFNIWPGFDIRLGRGAILPDSEEHLAFFQLIEKGYRVAFTPHAVVRHPYPKTIDQFRRCQLNTLRNSVAYMSLLAAECPAYRMSLIKYLARSATGSSLPWRLRGPKRSPVPFWSASAAGLSGLQMYLRVRRQRSP